MNFKNKDFISIKEYSKNDLELILKTAKEMPGKDFNKLKTFGKPLSQYVLAALFFEPSTRTRLSFETAIKSLGGSVIGFSDPSDTSLSKGETLDDMAKIVSGYCHVIVIRHKQVGTAKLFADNATVPVINAGDGTNEHPTQTLLDLYTILSEKGRLTDLKVGFVGDLKYGRTVHSLAYALNLFEGNQLQFISPKSLEMPEHHLKCIKDYELVKINELIKASKDLDVIYATRIQKERFPLKETDPEYIKTSKCYKIDENFLSKVNPEITIMHPLPRVGEISPRLDVSPNAAYIRQAENGLPVRQALLCLLLGVKPS